MFDVWAVLLKIQLHVQIARSENLNEENIV
jgi:hypothetical protein